MVKYFIPVIRSDPRSIVQIVKSKWIALFFLLPLIAYLIFRLFEAELTYFIIPFFPAEPDKSFGFYNDFLRLCFHEMLWYSFFLLTSWILFTYVPLHTVISSVEKRLLARSGFYTISIAGFFLVMALGISYFTLQTFPNSADEYVYLYQAETLSHGKLFQESHPLPNFFHFNHIAQKEGVSVGRFPPGWPLLLSLPYILGFPPFWLNALLGFLGLLFFYHFAKNYYSPRVAMWSLLSLAFAPFYVFNAASYFSHTSCLLFTVGFVYCLYRHQEMQHPGFGFLAGIFLGLIVITRYYNAVLIFIPVLIYLVYQKGWRAFLSLVAIGAGTLPFFLFLFWYNYQITGNGFLPVTVWADPEETLGFVKDHSFLKGVEHLIRRLLLFVYWCSPALLILYVVFLFKKIKNKALRFLHPADYFTLLLLAGYFFYHHLGGNQYGPRFLLEGLPFLIVFVVSKVFQTRAKWAAALFAAGLIYGIVKFPYIMEREQRVVEERMDLFEVVKEAEISNAVVLVSTHTGVIRPMPARDLTRNGLHFTRDIIYAQDQREKNEELMQFYPERSFYRYVRDPEQVEGKLLKIR